MAEKRRFRIETPRGKIQTIEIKNGPNSGTIYAKLTWNPKFKPEKELAFNNAQEFVDSECLRYMNPLTPRRTGMLIKSGTLGTVIGSGSIEYLAPYARRQYYENKGGTDGQRGKLWFERMKASKKEAIQKGANVFAAGGK